MNTTLMFWEVVEVVLRTWSYTEDWLGIAYSSEGYDFVLADVLKGSFKQGTKDLQEGRQDRISIDSINCLHQVGDEGVIVVQETQETFGVEGQRECLTSKQAKRVFIYKVFFKKNLQPLKVKQEVNQKDFYLSLKWEDCLTFKADSVRSEEDEWENRGTQLSMIQASGRKGVTMEMSAPHSFFKKIHPPYRG